jgi:endogenous inhibitor of DNA gyrase (YacG/DUF329 family)
MRCPTCKHEVLPRPANAEFPFCSKRCRAVDLGRWLGEEFRIVDSSPDADEDGQAIPNTSDRNSENDR